MGIKQVVAYRLVCDICGEHDGRHLGPEVLPLDDDGLEYGWTYENDTAICEACHTEIHQTQCQADGDGHVWDTPQNRHLAAIWTGEPEFIMRHCGRDCGRTEMRRRESEWFGFDRYGWLGDHQSTREESRRMRDSIFRT